MVRSKVKKGDPAHPRKRKQILFCVCLFLLPISVCSKYSKYAVSNSDFSLSFSTPPACSNISKLAISNAQGSTGVFESLFGGKKFYITR